MSVFQADYVRCFELLYQNKDYPGETRFLKGLLDEYVPDAESLLELGCGMGKHARLFAEKGFSVVGVDRSKAMLEEAEKRTLAGDPVLAAKLAWKQSDMQSVSLDNKFDGVLSLFHVINYLTSDEDLKSVFKVAASHLKPGGIFLFDSWYGPTVDADPPKVCEREVESEDVHIKRFCKPDVYADKHIVDVNYTLVVTDKKTGAVEETKETHRMRYLFPEEIKSFFEEAGFELVTSGEWMTGKAPGDDTFGVYFIGRRK